MNRKNMNLTASKNNIENDKINKKKSTIKIPNECKSEFIRAVKIGYYKEFFNQGLITAEQLERLIAMQNSNSANSAA